MEGEDEESAGENEGKTGERSTARKNGRDYCSRENESVSRGRLRDTVGRR